MIPITVLPVSRTTLTEGLLFLLFMMILFPCAAKDFEREVNHVSRKDGSMKERGMAGKRAGRIYFYYYCPRCFNSYT